MLVVLVPVLKQVCLHPMGRGCLELAKSAVQSPISLPMLIQVVVEDPQLIKAVAFATAATAAAAAACLATFQAN